MSEFSPGKRPVGVMSSSSRDNPSLLPLLVDPQDEGDLVSILKSAEKTRGAVYFDVSARATRRRFHKGSNGMYDGVKGSSSLRVSAVAPGIEPPPELMKRFAKVSSGISRHFYYLYS